MAEDFGEDGRKICPAVDSLEPTKKGWVGVEHPGVLSEPLLYAIVLSIKKGVSRGQDECNYLPCVRSRKFNKGHKPPAMQFLWCRHTPLGEPKKELFAEVLNLQKSFPDC